MKTPIWRGVAIAALLFASACGRPPSAPSTPAEAIGESTEGLTEANRICADWPPYREQIDWYCGDTQNVSDVYQEARRRAGAGSVDLWVLWPMDEGQESDAKKIKAWFDQAKHVLTWLKGQPDLDLFQRSIEAMQNGKNRLSQSQGRLILKKSNGIADAVNAVQAAVKARAIDPQQADLMNALADTKIKVGEMKAILQRTTTMLTALQPAYQQLVFEFKRYKASEAGVSDRISGFARAASTADLAQLARIKTSVADYARTFAAPSSTLQLDAQALQAQLIAVQEQNDLAFEPYQDFMASRGHKPITFVDTALRSAGNMMTYCESRQAMTDAAIAKLTDGLRARTDALIELLADRATRDTLANTRFSDAAKGFLDQSTVRIAQLWAAPPTTPSLGYSLYAEQYDAFTAFQQMQPSCAEAALANSSWMKSGCEAMNPSFSRAASWVKDTLPGVLQMRLILLRRKGANEALCKQVEAQVAAGNLKAAAAAYDAAARTLDPGTTRR